MTILEGKTGGKREQVGGVRLRHSIALPIVLLLLTVSAGLLLAGYLINKSVFHSVFEERERDKARDAHRMIESAVSKEAGRILGLAKILKNDTDIVYGLFHHAGTRGDARPLRLAMDQLFPKMGLSVFAMTDTGGRVLYSAGKGPLPEARSLAGMHAFRRALEGRQVTTTMSVSGRSGIRVIAPVHVFGSEKPAGVLILGTDIDDAFAGRIARETGNQVFFATSEKVIAGSYDISLANAFDPRLAQASLAKREPVFHINDKIYRSYTYVPIAIADEDFCLLIESDIGVIRELLAKNRARMTRWGLWLLAGIGAAGAGLALLLIRPLKRLHGTALAAIREYSGREFDGAPAANEISTLVRANDVMLETIKNHLAERRRAEEAYHETSGILHALIEASPLAVVVSDASGTVRVWNPAAVRIFGWGEAETIGRPNPLLAPDENRELRTACGLVLRGERFSNTEIRCRARDGSEVFVAFSAAPLLDPQGKIDSMMAILADVTDARKAEDALRRSEEQLRQSMKMEAVGKLAGGVAHDFNNLLSVITGYSELLLLRTDARNPARREIEEIHKAGERAAALTHQLLAFSRRQVLEPKRLRMDEVVANLARMLRRLIGEDIDFATESGKDLWTVLADPNQIEQILMNLCVNARDAMPSGGRLVISTGNVILESPLVERELTIPPGRYASLRVADSGTGMSEEVLSRLFEPFYTTKKQGKGTGLGLATVYGIVKQSGGYIRVESALGKGTTFTVYLPAVEGAAENSREPSAEMPAEPAAAGGTLLLVEDEDMVRELAVEIFRDSGFTVFDAPNGPAALEICERHDGRIDLLVTDLVMPGMNGIELARRVRKARPGIRVLYMSGYAEDAKQHLGRLGRDEAFLQKPLTPTTLARKVRDLLPEPADAVRAGSAAAPAARSRPGA